MSAPATSDEHPSEARERRRYDSPLRRQRAAETRERILAAGSALVHGFTTWDWRALTFRAIAEQAGVSERTVYRHFPTERGLLDAIMRRLEEEAGVCFDAIDLDEVSDLTARGFATLSSFAVSLWVPENPHHPTLVAEDQRRRDALLGAVVARTSDWSDVQRRMVAAMLDVLSNVPSYERLVAAWNLDADQTTRAITWSIDLLVEAIGRGDHPDAERRTGDRRPGAG